MARTLDVYLHRHFVGHLVRNDHGEMIFGYAESWLENPEAVPLSHSLPLRKEQFSRRECRGFFSGILPEGGKREIVARNLGISARNDFAMLEEIGGECAGAVTFMPAGEPLPARDYQYRNLSNQELANILKELPRRPLMAGEDGVRLSLAGAQDKIAVHVKDGQLSIPLGNAPSTHILKPAIDRFEGVVFNEALCMTLARITDLPAANVEIHTAGNIDYLLVERYDRTHAAEGNVHRLHQEDFCQALGIASENKYQNEGGPSLKNCFALLREVSSAPVIDLQRLLDAVIFNFLVGNNDAHGKNFSFIYEGGEARLAPLYDIVCTLYYPELSKKMAMKIGGEYKTDMIFPRHFEKLAEEAGLARPLVRSRVPELADHVIAGLDEIGIEHDVADGVKKLIRELCKSAADQFGDERNNHSGF